MTSSRVEELFRAHRLRIEEALDRYVPAAAAVPAIQEAMRYSPLAGGKRVRPAMALATAEMLGAEEAEILPAACALEMDRTVSLRLPVVTAAILSQLIRSR